MLKGITYLWKQSLSREPRWRFQKTIQYSQQNQENMVNERGRYSDKRQNRPQQKCKKWDKSNRKINEEERGNELDDTTRELQVRGRTVQNWYFKSQTGNIGNKQDEGENIKTIREKKNWRPTNKYCPNKNQTVPIDIIKLSWAKKKKKDRYRLKWLYWQNCEL